MITIMEGRLKAIQESVEIFNNTGKILLGLDGGDNLIPIDGMNFGLFYLSYFFKSLLNLSPTLLIHFIFLFFIILSSLIIFYLLYLLFESKKILFSVLFINLFTLFYIIKKIYLLNIEYLLYFLPIIITVLFIECIKKNKIKFNNLIFFFLIILYFFCESVKTFSSIGAIIYFYVFVLFEKKKANIGIFTIIFSLIISFSGSINYISEKIQKKNYFEINQTNYEVDYLVGASKWQPIYLGLSYISNSYVDAFEDNTTKKFLKLKNKNYIIINTETNEKILKNEVLSIFQKDKSFFFRLISAKIGTIFAWIFLFANISLVYFFKPKLENYKRLGIFLCLSFYSIFPIVAIPVTFYITGIIGTSVSLFNLMMIDKDFENTVKRIVLFIKN